MDYGLIETANEVVNFLYESSRLKSHNEKFDSGLFAARLLFARKELNFTQDEAAKKLGVGRVSLIRYENGDRLPSTEILAKICEGYKVSPSWLFWGE